MMAFLLAIVVLYIVVRLAVRHGATDAEQGRLERERSEAFEQMIVSGNLPDAPTAKQPEVP